MDEDTAVLKKKRITQNKINVVFYIHLQNIDQKSQQITDEEDGDHGHQHHCQTKLSTLLSVKIFHEEILHIS